MNPRNRILITVAWLCHLLLLPQVVTCQWRADFLGDSQQKSAEIQKENSAGKASTPCAQQAAQRTDKSLPLICSLSQEKDGDVYKLHGDVEIHYGDYVLRADDVTYDSDSGLVTATGHFQLDGGENDDHIRASRGTYNLTTETGRFYDVTATTGLRFVGSKVLLTSTAPFAFSGKTVEKDSPDHYLVYDGTITTCELPHPKWQFRAHSISVDVGGNATITRSTFMLHGLPVLYFPYATHPVERQKRESGFLIPTAGRSSSKGNIVGDAFYWAINRSMDATLGAEYFSKRGWSQRGEFRARPSETSYIDLSYFGVNDRERQGGQNARLNAEGTFYGFRSVANVDYLSSYLFRLAFNEVFTQAVYSEVKSQAFLSKATNGFFLSGMAERYQNFQSTTAGDAIKISHVPSLDFSSVDRSLWHTPIYWSLDASVAGLARSEPGFRTGNLLARFDINPEISLPVLFKGWSVRPSLILHDTYYTERFVPDETGGTAHNQPVNRRAIEGDLEVRPPALERVFDKEFLGRKWKHVIEPRFVYRKIAGVDDFSSLLRFDERDVLADTHEIEYGFVTRLYAKRTHPRDADHDSEQENCGVNMSALIVGAAAPEQKVPWERPSNLDGAKCEAGPEVREVATWSLAQKYFIDPTFGGALDTGQRNVFTTTEDLTGIAFATQPRHLSPIVSRLRVETSARTDTEWDLDYDFQLGRINASTLLVNYHVGPFTIGGGDSFLQIPQPNTFPFLAGSMTQKFQQFRVALGYGGLNKRGFSTATSFGIDSESGLLQFATAQTTYNWDCCGMTMEYRRYSVANIRNENLFRFTFTLANVGAFGNLRRQERLY